MLTNLEATFNLIGTFRATVSETLLPATSASDRRIQMKEANLGSTVLTASSTPALEAGVPLSLTMATGVPVAIDLTAAPQPGGEDALDLTGQRLIGMIACTAEDNAGTIEIAPADSDGYDLWGTDAGCRIPAKSTLAFLDQVASRELVAAGAKVIEFDGQTGDEIEVILFFGS